ncbi:MAG: methyl-coenzyme M reductase subunit beta [Candidatus Helarchaeota archaeon]|nr:methyl-coenzyme M reductase subunit beta [Candidatus Helarchaeota archaeon]
MKFEDKIDIYNDLGKCLAEDLPIETLSPLNNPYMNRVLTFLKSTAFVNLKKIERMLRQGKVGYSSTSRQDEINMPWHARDWNIVANAANIAEKLDKLIQVSYNKGKDGTFAQVLPGNDIIMVKIPFQRMIASSGRDPPLSITAVAMGQALSEIFDVTPNTDPDGVNILKNVLLGRYPQTMAFQPGNPIFSLLQPTTVQEGLGTGFKTITINHIVALAEKRTFDAVVLASIVDQAAQFEMGNALGWFERYHLLGLAYQGLNGDRLVLDLIEQNKEGTVGDVVSSLIRIGLEDKVLKQGRGFPAKVFSGYRMYTAKDYPRWNAYMCAGLLAASIVNVGASRAAQSVASVFSGFSDLCMFESGGLPDPDCGRIMGIGLGLTKFAHDEGGAGGIGAFTLNNNLIRHSSGFVSPCLAAAMCLDSGTQLFRPEVTSGVFFRLKQVDDLFSNPLEKIVTAAEEIKSSI